MAITAPTTTGQFAGFIQPEMAQGIFDEAARISVIQRLARQVPLAASGAKIPVVTGKPKVGWVGEAQRKPTTSGSIGLKSIEPHKAAAIVVVSAEVVRANPGGYVTSLRPQLAEAFGLAFDLGALHNKGGDGTGTGPFPTYIDQTTKTVTLGTAAQTAGGIHADFTAGLKLLVSDKKRLTGFALDDRLEPDFWGAVDANGRPLYVDLPTDQMSDAYSRPGRLLNRPSAMHEGISLDGTAGLAYGGDWTQCAWGVVGGISYDVSTQATVTINGELVSLWENNLMAIRAEAEYGFLVNDPQAFVRYNGKA